MLPGVAMGGGLDREPCKMGPAGQHRHSEQANALNDFEKPGTEGVSQESAASSNQCTLREVR